MYLKDSVGSGWPSLRWVFRFKFGLHRKIPQNDLSPLRPWPYHSGKGLTRIGKLKSQNRPYLKQSPAFFIIHRSGLWWRQIHLHGFLQTKKLHHLFVWNQVELQSFSQKWFWWCTYFSTMWEFEDIMDTLNCKVFIIRTNNCTKEGLKLNGLLLEWMCTILTFCFPRCTLMIQQSASLLCVATVFPSRNLASLLKG